MDHHQIQKMIPMYSLVTVSQSHISVPDLAVLLLQIWSNSKLLIKLHF